MAKNASMGKICIMNKANKIAIWFFVGGRGFLSNPTKTQYLFSG